jgi:hypothetical protein
MFQKKERLIGGIMKSKNFKKKLTLNKKTVADLSSGSMKNARGGIHKPSVSACDPGCTMFVSACEGTCTCCGGGDSVVVCGPSC